MKVFLMLISGLVAALPAAASDTVCTADIPVPPRSVAGKCTAGQCTGSFSSIDISASGSCDDGQRFAASAISDGGTLVGKCDGGSFLGVGSNLTLKFSGTCSAASSFAGNSYSRFQYASGTCEENGPFNASIEGVSVSISGVCK